MDRLLVPTVMPSHDGYSEIMGCPLVHHQLYFSICAHQSTDTLKTFHLRCISLDQKGCHQMSMVDVDVKHAWKLLIRKNNVRRHVKDLCVCSWRYSLQKEAPQLKPALPLAGDFRCARGVLRPRSWRPESFDGAPNSASRE